MADKNKEKDVDVSSKPRVRKLMGFLQQNMDLAYKKTHFTQASNSNDLDFIKTKLDNSIDGIIGNSIDDIGSPNISSLYDKLNIAGVTDQDGKRVKLDDLFNESAMSTNVMASVLQNEDIKEYDQEIDIVCKYMPSLDDALDAKKDNVLSADHFSKDFLSIMDNKKSIEENLLVNNFNALKKRYKLLEKLDHYYEQTAKYGEAFIYIVPYKKALAQLLAQEKVIKEEGALNEGVYTFQENTVQDIIFETKVSEKDINGLIKESTKQGSLKLEIDRGFALTEAVKELHELQKFSNKLQNTLIDFDPSKAEEEFTKPKGIKPSLSTDGMVDVREEQDEIEKKLKIPGCIMKELQREMVIPLYIEDMCLGYYYIETHDNKALENSNGMLTANRMFNRNGVNGQQQSNNLSMEENILKNVSQQIADKLDTEFVAANPELKSEIYKILKYNEQTEGASVKITFLPPNDVVHMYFKKDQKTKRGISDLDRALLPAKIYSSVYVVNALGILTRSQDRRVIYVKQNVDTNISGVLLNTINQIKKSNFGSREMSNIKTLLNLTGRYNDYIIPTGPSGDAPVQFEMMQGQTIDTQEDFLNRLEEMAVNSTDVPFEYIQSRKNVDYAVRLTMSSGKFLRKVYKRQAQTQEFFTRIINIIYASEYSDKVGTKESDLVVILPPPTLLNIMNTNQMFTNLNDFTEFVTSIVYTDADDPNNTKRQLFAAELKKHHLGTTIDLSSIGRIKQEVDIKINKNETGQDDQ